MLNWNLLMRNFYTCSNFYITKGQEYFFNIFSQYDWKYDWLQLGALSNHIPVLYWSEMQACTNSLLFPVTILYKKRDVSTHPGRSSTLFQTDWTLDGGYKHCFFGHWYTLKRNHLIDANSSSAADSEDTIASHPLNCLSFLSLD